MPNSPLPYFTPTPPYPSLSPAPPTLITSTQQSILTTILLFHLIPYHPVPTPPYSTLLLFHPTLPINSPPNPLPAPSNPTPTQLHPTAFSNTPYTLLQPSNPFSPPYLSSTPPYPTTPYPTPFSTPPTPYFTSPYPSTYHLHCTLPRDNILAQNFMRDKYPLTNMSEKFSISSKRFKFYVLLVYSFMQDIFSHLADFNEIFSKHLLSKSLKVFCPKIIPAYPNSMPSCPSVLLIPFSTPPYPSVTPYFLLHPCYPLLNPHPCPNSTHLPPTAGGRLGQDELVGPG